jgi:hypothetical protein
VRRESPWRSQARKTTEEERYNFWTGMAHRWCGTHQSCGEGDETEVARRGVRCSVSRCGGAVDSLSPRGEASGDGHDGVALLPLREEEE